MLAEEIPIEGTKIPFTNNRDLPVDNGEGFSQQVKNMKRAFPTWAKDKVCFAV